MDAAKNDDKRCVECRKKQIDVRSFMRKQINSGGKNETRFWQKTTRRKERVKHGKWLVGQQVVGTQ